MVTKTELMGLGIPPIVAELLANTPIRTSAFGATQASAAPMAARSQLIMITATNNGSGISMPLPTGDPTNGAGAANGDVFFVMNALSANIQIYSANNAQGSAVTFFVNAVSAAGTTGFSLAAGNMAVLMPVTGSTWVGIKSSA